MDPDGRRCPHCLAVAPRQTSWPMRIIRIMQRWEDEAYEDLTSDDPARKVHNTRHVRKPAEIRAALIEELAREQDVDAAEVESQVPNPRSLRQIVFNMYQSGDLQKGKYYFNQRELTGWVLPDHLYRNDETLAAAKTADYDYTLQASLDATEPTHYDVALVMLKREHGLEGRAGRDVITRGIANGTVLHNEDVSYLWRLPRHG